MPFAHILLAPISKARDFLPFSLSVQVKERPTVKRDQTAAVLDNEIRTDDRTEAAWDTCQAVERIAASMTPESQDLRLQRVCFDQQSRQEALHAVFTAGTVIGTPKPGVLLVPERTLTILSELGIPYHIVEQ